MRLSELHEGESAEIVSVASTRGLKESLYSLGFLPGALIRVEARSGSMMLVRIYDEEEVAMTLDVAEKIEVKKAE